MDKRDLAPTYVALDLETTGLNPDRDTIIEIGSVKFRGQQVLETFQTLVNPYGKIPEAIQRLTGIDQRGVDRAPSFGAVAGELQDFIGPLPVVGHNISFDLGFLSRHGLQLANEAYDTWDLASILLPYVTNYSLSSLAEDLGAKHTRPHRALDDAQATQEVFTILLDRANQLDPAIVAYIQHLASRARWGVGHLFGALPSFGSSHTGIMGLDTASLGNRLGQAHKAVRPSRDVEPLDEGELAAYLAPGGLFSRTFPGFEHRPQQVEMMRAVACAVNKGEHLIVEGGTGVGKSLAYLLPVLLYSLKNGSRVVVSTNTINLQEQLLQKDIPALARVLEEEGIIPKGEFRAVPLKGRANYLCLRRWNNLARGDSLSPDEARLLSKTLVWLQDTSNGDRGEINLSGMDSVTWSRISAGEKGQCPGIRGEGLCFLRTARDRAEGAQIVIVNHALLLSDLAMGGGLIPDYQHLIIDEAHHLEDEATRQLGFQVSQNQLTEELDSLGRILENVRARLRLSSLSSSEAQRAENMLAQLGVDWSGRMRDNWNRLWDSAEKFLYQHREGGGEQLQLRITRSSRAQPAWSDLEIAWENVDTSLTDGIRQTDRLRRLLENVPTGGELDFDTLVMDLSTWQEGSEELQDRLKTLLGTPTDERRVDWMALVGGGKGDPSSRSNLVLQSAPLRVGQELEERLFSRKRSVILTSATLTTEGNFDYIRERVGMEESEEVLVGSPFDYHRAALLLIPEDMPAPDASGYQQAMETLLVALARGLDGHTLVLFTSHAALRGTAHGIRGPLGAEGIRVLAQGIDGSPRQIHRSFSEDARGVILGTSSFWEGVDLSGGVLKSLVIARLPFNVPTDPVFAARSDQYEEPFREYALPQAVLRLRQGIGRLIRGSDDKGTIVLLDRRIIARAYGKAFLDSLPPCSVKRGPLSAIPGYAAEWVGKVS